jgi:ABC-type Fe3+/spermidine/putrescine transport system ATPase subunit
MIEIQNLSMTFGPKALFREINLRVNAGELIVLTGPSGSGKTSLLRIIAGLQTPDSGKVFLNGELATDGRHLCHPPHRRGVGFVFQDLGLWGNLTVLHNVIIGTLGQKMRREERHERARSTLASFQIAHLASRKPGRISGGEQQRVALARAMVTEPKILLLDEPFGSLDFGLRETMHELVSNLVQDGPACIAVTHDPQDAVGLGAKRVVALEGEGCIDFSLAEWTSTEAKSQTACAWRRSIDRLKLV